MGQCCRCQVLNKNESFPTRYQRLTHIGKISETKSKNWVRHRASFSETKSKKISKNWVPYYDLSAINITDLDKRNFSRLVQFQRDRCIGLRLKENLQEIIDDENDFLQKITQYYYLTYFNINS